MVLFRDGLGFFCGVKIEDGHQEDERVRHFLFFQRGLALMGQD